MSEPNKLPSSISHKKLSYLMLNAKKDKFTTSEDNDNYNLDNVEFLELIDDWEIATKNLLKKISTRNKNLLNDKNSNSLMALGAMEVHLNMAIQALNAFKNDKTD